MKAYYNHFLGELTITRPLDYELQREHRFLVGMFHPGDVVSRGSYITLLVEVLDVNEFPPTFLPLQPFVATVDTPMGTTIGRISAYDWDSLGGIEPNITYSITPGWSLTFLPTALMECKHILTFFQ